jgi:hypothetical protein
MRGTSCTGDLAGRNRCTPVTGLTGIYVRGYRRHCVTAQGSWWESSTVAPL